MTEAADPPEHGRRGIPRRFILAAIVVAVVGLALWALLRRGDADNRELFTGYVVADDIYMSSPVGGTLATLSVARGQRVDTGAALFQIDPTVRAADTEQARAQVSASAAQVNQLQSALAAARNQLASAQAQADKAQAELQRLTAAQQEKAGSVAQLQLDQANAAYKAAIGQRDAARSQLGSAQAAIDAASAQVRRSEAGLTSARQELAYLSPLAPGPGRVEDTMFKPGELVPPNVPVVSIVPDGEVKVRFYVPQSLVAQFQPGRQVAIGCDGCKAGMTARVNFVASEPEYTPPVIYSLDARQKLVFMVEALPSDPRALTPGQPIDIAPAAGDLPQQ